MKFSTFVHLIEPLQHLIIHHQWIITLLLLNMLLNSAEPVEKIANFQGKCSSQRYLVWSKSTTIFFCHLHYYPILKLQWHPPSHPQPNFHNWLKQLHEGIHGLLYAPPLPKKLEDESVSTTANINHTLTISTDGSFQQVGKTSPTRKSFLSGWSMSISAPHHSPTSP